MISNKLIHGLLTMVLAWGLGHAEIPTDGAVVFSASSNLKSAGPAKFIIISGGKASPAKTLTSQNGLNFRISPDGAYVAFDDNKSIYVCELKENAQAVKVGDGMYPSWIGMGSGTKLFWSNKTGKIGFGTGNSYLQSFDLKTMKLTGSAIEPKYNGKSSIMKGGIDVNGKYASTGYPDSYIAQVDGKANACGSGQKCNPSVSPTSGKAMFLDNTGHTVFGIYGSDGKKIRDFSPGGKVQNPKWATHEDWCSWVQGDHSGNNVLIGKIGGSGSQVYTGIATFPHLYVGKMGQAQPTLLRSVKDSKLGLIATGHVDALNINVLSEGRYALTVFTMAGRKIFSESKEFGSEHRIDHLGKGNYLIRLHSAERVLTKAAVIGK